jgi:two-component system chemotaxis sensor kinase CheA
VDLSQYLDLFVSEAQDHLQEMNRALLALEQKPGDLSCLEAFFRAAHTLKGMSAALGFQQMATLSHTMEDLLHALRQKECPFTADLADLLFRSLDTLNSLLQGIAAGEGETADIVSIQAALRAIQERPAELPSRGVSGLVGAGDGQVSRAGWELQVEVAPDCVLKSARAFLVLKRLAAVAPIVRCEPPEAVLRAGQYEERLRVFFAPGADPQALQAAANSVAEVVAATAQEVGSDFHPGLASAPPQSPPSDGGEAIPSPVRTGEPTPAAPRGPGGQGGGGPVATILKGESTLPVVEGDNLPPGPPPARRGEPISPFPITAKPPSAQPPFGIVGEGGQGDRSEPSPAGTPVTPVVRIKVALLDQLLQAVADLVVNRSHLSQVARRHALPDLKEAVEANDSAMNRLQETVLAMRMTPVAHVFNRFPRMVRDLAHQQGKEVRFEMEGTELELDRTILEKITDSLVHLLRNAVDHGIESPEERRASGKPAAAHVRLQARRAQDKAIVEVRDDGQGLSPQKILKVALERGLITPQAAGEMETAAIFDLICRPGFSTKTQVTGVSGRGVGMEVVKQAMEEVGGTLEIDSQPGQGACFRLTFPLTMAILPALMVRVGAEMYALPMTHVVRTIEPLQSDVRRLHHQPVLRWEEKILPLAYLADVLECARGENAAEEISVVVVERGRQQVGLVVDEIIGKEEIVLKPLEGILGQIEGLAGVTIQGAGDIVLVLDVAGLLRLLEPGN